MGKIYVIGDIHGCIKTLKELVSRLDDGSRLITVGDMVDKGPHSKEVIDFCINNNIESVKGNHEHFFLKFMSDYINGIDITHTKWYNEWGGDTTVKSYNGDIEKIKQHLEYILSLPLYKEITVLDKTYFITHGFGLPYYDNKDHHSSHIAIISNRLYGTYFNIDNIDTLDKYNVINVFGHDSFKEVQKHNLYYGIDTGCVYDKTANTAGELTAIELYTNDIISVSVLDEVNYSNSYY